MPQKHLPLSSDANAWWPAETHRCDNPGDPTGLLQLWRRQGYMTSLIMPTMRIGVMLVGQVSKALVALHWFVANKNTLQCYPVL